MGMGVCVYTLGGRAEWTCLISPPATDKYQELKRLFCLNTQAKILGYASIVRV